MRILRIKENFEAFPPSNTLVLLDCDFTLTSVDLSFSFDPSDRPCWPGQPSISSQFIDRYRFLLRLILPRHWYNKVYSAIVYITVCKPWLIAIGVNLKIPFYLAFFLTFSINFTQKRVNLVIKSCKIKLSGCSVSKSIIFLI